MTTLLASNTATAATATEGDVKTFLDNLRTVIAEFLGTDTANKATALATLQSLFAGSLTKTAAYSVAAADRGKTIIATGTGGWTLTLTAAATLGDGFVFAVVNNSSGVITIDPNLSETVNGATTYSVLAGETTVVFCDGTKFILFGNVAMTLEGQRGALTINGLQTHSAGTKYIPFGRLEGSLNQATASTSMVESRNIRFFQSGTFRFSFRLKTNTGAATASAQIYKNGAAAGTLRSTTSIAGVVYTEDLAISAGDTVQIFYKCSSASDTAAVRESKVGTAGSPLFSPFVDIEVGQR